MWVNVEFLTPINGLVGVKMNLANAAAVEEREDVFMLNFAGEAYYRVKKTPEMVEAYNSLVPEKSQPVVPAEPDQYEWVTQDIEPVRPGVDQYRYLRANGCERSMWDLASSHDRGWDDRCVHGWVDPDGDTLELRCRRFQLPEVPKPKEPFRITGLGLYETVNGETVHISEFDTTDCEGAPWCTDKRCWYDPDGTYHGGSRPDCNIVKLIKLDEVQP